MTFPYVAFRTDAIRRIFRFISRAIQFHSISSAFWVDAFENFKPKHGK